MIGGERARLQFKTIKIVIVPHNIPHYDTTVIIILYSSIVESVGVVVILLLLQG